MKTILFVLLTIFAFQLNAQQVKNPFHEHLQKLHEKGKFNGTAENLYFLNLAKNGNTVIPAITYLCKFLKKQAV